MRARRRSSDQQSGEFTGKPVWSRIAIVAAGPLANLLFAVAAFWLMFVVGKPDYQAIVGRVDGLAASAGLVPGERIVGVGGQKIDTWSDVSMALLRGALERQPLPLSTRCRRRRLRTHARAEPASARRRRDRCLPGDRPHAAPLGGAGGGRPTRQGGAAEAAGLRAGDRPRGRGRRAGARLVRRTAAGANRAAAGQALQIRFERGGTAQTLAVTPHRDGTGEASRSGASVSLPRP